MSVLLKSILYCGVSFLASLVLGNHDAKQLYDDLLRKHEYNKLIRPVGNVSEKLVIKLGLKFTQIIEVVSQL